MQTTDLLISLSVVLVIRLWQSGVIQGLVNRQSRKLPAWAQPIPPLVLSVLATVVVWLVGEPSKTALVDVLADGGLSGALAVGLYHVAKRWTPAGLVGKVKTAAAGGAALLFVACSGAPVAPAHGATAASVAQVAIAAIAATDAALAAAIDNLPPGADTAPWEARVEQLEQAAELVRDSQATAEEVCRAAGTVAPVASAIECERCVDAIETIQGIACRGES